MMKRFLVLMIGSMFFSNMFVNLFLTFPVTKLVVEGLTGVSIGWDRTDEEKFAGLQKMYNELRSEMEATKGKADEFSGLFSCLVTDNARKAGEERKKSIAYQEEFYRAEFMPLRSEVYQVGLSLKSIRYELNRLTKLLRKKEVITESEWPEWATAF
mgnify:CR=1 FL=1